MKKRETNIQEIMRDIAGVWHNPVTRNIYCFYSIASENGYATVDILQSQQQESLTFGYRMFYEQDMLYIDIEGTRSAITELKLDGQPVISFITPDREIITLIRGFPLIE